MPYTVARATETAQALKPVHLSFPLGFSWRRAGGGGGGGLCELTGAEAAAPHLDGLHQAHPLIHRELVSAKLASSHEPAI